MSSSHIRHNAVSPGSQKIHFKIDRKSSIIFFGIALGGISSGKDFVTCKHSRRRLIDGITEIFFPADKTVKSILLWSKKKLRIEA